jgi:anti-anti-sigma factor
MNLAVDIVPVHLTVSQRLAAELAVGRVAGLRASSERSGTAVIVYTGGEVDAANEHTWRRLLGEAAAAVAAPGPLVIDTDGLEFMGCCAFTALAEQADRCRRRGIDLRPVSGKPITARIIAAGGLGPRLCVYPTVDDALIH